jgi:hypothetical protein
MIMFALRTAGLYDHGCRSRVRSIPQQSVGYWS